MGQDVPADLMAKHHMQHLLAPGALSQAALAASLEELQQPLTSENVSDHDVQLHLTAAAQVQLLKHLYLHFPGKCAQEQEQDGRSKLVLARPMHTHTHGDQQQTAGHKACTCWLGTHALLSVNTSEPYTHVSGCLEHDANNVN